MIERWSGLLISMNERDIMQPLASPIWSFSQPATAAITPALQPTHFYRSDTIRRWERFGYSVEDARSLIEYLNERTQP